MLGGKTGERIRSPVGFDGRGRQVRDLLHPLDLQPLLKKQQDAPTGLPRTVNLGGGAANAMSLAQLSAWCRQRFGDRTVGSDPAPRPLDIPWLVMDAALAGSAWNWSAERGLESILAEIADHAERNPDWLEMTTR